LAGEPAPDGEDLDAYVLGVDRPLDIFRGLVIAVIHREDDVEDNWLWHRRAVGWRGEEGMRAPVLFSEPRHWPGLFLCVG